MCSGVDLCPHPGRMRRGKVRLPTAKWQGRKIGSSYAGINRIKFIGFAGQPEFQTAPVSVPQHTPEQPRV